MNRCPSTIRAWNNLPNEIKESTSVSTFKFQLNKNHPKPHKYFNVGSRLDQVLGARLRIECTVLNADLYQKILSTAFHVNVVVFNKPITSFSYAESRRNLSIRLENYSINRLLYEIEDSTLQEHRGTAFLTSCGRYNLGREPTQARAHQLKGYLHVTGCQSIIPSLSLSLSFSLSLSLSLICIHIYFVRSNNTRCIKHHTTFWEMTYISLC